MFCRYNDEFRWQVVTPLPVGHPFAQEFPRTKLTFGTHFANSINITETTNEVAILDTVAERNRWEAAEKAKKQKERKVLKFGIGGCCTNDQLEAYSNRCREGPYPESKG